MDSSFQDLLKRLDHLSDQFNDLRVGVQKAIRIADEDPEMALTRSRKVLEYIVRDVYHRRIGEPAGSRPLEHLLQRIVKDGHLPGRLDAFATWLPYRQGRGRSLDLMRSRADAKGVMDFLIVETIDHFKAREVQEVSLGNAPLANVDDNVKQYVREERVVKFLFENFNRYYGYKSLFEFKKKYQPVWQGRYLGCRPSANPLWVVLALVRVHLPQGIGRLLRS